MGNGTPSGASVPPPRPDVPHRRAAPMRPPDNVDGADGKRNALRCVGTDPTAGRAPHGARPPRFEGLKISKRPEDPRRPSKDLRHPEQISLLDTGGGFVVSVRAGRRPPPPVPFPADGLARQRARISTTSIEWGRQRGDTCAPAPAPSPSLLRPHDLEQGRETPLKAVSSRLTTPREPSQDRAHPVSRSPRSAPT